MPIYYNTSAPTPTTSNSINNVSINIRDFLLQKNLEPTYPSISTSINGGPRIGEPVLDTETNFLNYYPQQKLEGDTSALDLLGSVINGQGIGIGAGGSPVPNFDVRASLAGRILGATGVLSDTKIGTIGAQQLALALANNAAFNLQQDILGTLNVQDNILSLIKGDGFADFPRPNYKITVPSSTGGRIFNAAASILGFTVPRSYLDESGSIFQSESGLETENIKRANSMILNTGKGQTKAMLSNIVANLSVNDEDGYNFFRSGYAPAYENNKGDVIVRDYKLYAYDDGNGHFINLLGFTEGGPIPNLSIFREQKTVDSGFADMKHSAFLNTLQPFPTTKVWVTNAGDAINNEYVEGLPISLTDKSTKKSILTKTQALFDSKGFKTLISSKGDMNINNASQTQTAVVGGGISKGNAVLKGNRFNLDGSYIGDLDSAENTYCRSYTAHYRYDKVNKMVRHSGLYSSEGKNPSDVNVPFRRQIEGSVLDDNGFAKITPYKGDTTDPKRFMFSIENLAWANNTPELSDCEKGPGDLITGKKGRIMWFPPYDINFSEQNSVNWESTNFIGRGEPVYTYNNTERSGNLSFKVIVDHPSYINSFAGSNGPDDRYIDSFWAGCVNPNKFFSDRLTVSERSAIVTTPQEKIPEKVIPKEEAPASMYIYWPNDRTSFDSIFLAYENGKCDNVNIDYDVVVDGIDCGIKNGYVGNYTPGSRLAGQSNTPTGTYPDATNYGLNFNGKIGINPEVDLGNGKKFRGWFDRPDEYKSAIVDYLKNVCPHCRVEVYGYASPHGKPENNRNLANDRRDKVFDKIKSEWGVQGLGLDEEALKKRFIKKDAIPLTYGNGSDCKIDYRVDNPFCKVDRRTEIRFVFDEELASADIPNPIPIKIETRQQINTKITNRFYSECDYFEKLKQDDYFIFDEFRKKIKYFHPAFHSTTPEGLNSRLTFLLQCTRQGPTLESENANNLAFGAPPVCILRIGDFYNTKIVMDNVSFDYEPLVWDLNPEGIGVQPMIANVTISFKFLGGSTLLGPINKLQNALSFNYFANTQVYDVRADYIAKDKDAKGNDGKPLDRYLIKNDFVPKDGMNPIIETNTKDLPPIEGENQTASSENSGVAPNDIPIDTTSTTIDDKKVLSRLTLFEFKWDPQNIENVLYRFNYNQNPPLALDKNSGKTYKGTITLKNWTTQELTVLETIKIRYNDDNSVIMNTETSEVILPSTQSERWLMDSEISNGDKLTEAKADTSTNYSVTLEWDVEGNPKSNANIIYSIQ